MKFLIKNDIGIKRKKGAYEKIIEINQTITKIETILQFTDESILKHIKGASNPLLIKIQGRVNNLKPI